MPPNASTEGHLVKGSRPGLLAKVILLLFAAIPQHSRHDRRKAEGRPRTFLWLLRPTKGPGYSGIQKITLLLPDAWAAARAAGEPHTPPSFREAS